MSHSFIVSALYTYQTKTIMFRGEVAGFPTFTDGVNPKAIQLEPKDYPLAVLQEDSVRPAQLTNFVEGQRYLYQGNVITYFGIVGEKPTFSRGKEVTQVTLEPAEYSLVVPA